MRRSDPGRVKGGLFFLVESVEDGMFERAEFGEFGRHGADLFSQRGVVFEERLVFPLSVLLEEEEG